MNFPTRILPAAVLLALASHAYAQQAATELSDVVVTANRVARTADETLASVSVITRQDIEQSQARSVPDLLSGLPGVQFANNGGPGKATSLFLRGTNDGHTLVLVDGVRVGSATLGSVSLQDIPVDQIERIEVVRGPRASLYGSDAIGGVIQIFTRKGAQAPAFRVGAGSRQTFEGAASGGFGSPDLWLNVGTTASSTRGINARETANEPDRDGYTQSSASVRGGGRIGEALSYDLQARHLEARNKYDGNPNISDVKQELYAGTLRYDVSERLSTSLKLAQNLDATSSFKEEKFSSRIDTRRSQASWENSFTLATGHELIGGLDYQYDEVLSNNAYDRAKRINRAAFAEYLGKTGRFDYQLAGRHDKNEQFGTHNTGSVAAGYGFSPALRVRTSYGTAFKAPSFNDLYYPNSGNPALQPEQSRTLEAGAGGKLGDFTWDASVFKTRLTNMIAWSPDANGDYKPANVARAHITGLELAASQKFGRTTLAASASFLNPKDHSGGATEGNLLARRARQSGSLAVDHELGRWAFGATLKGTGKRYDTASNAVKLGGYSTTDLRAEYRFTPAWRVQTRVENVFDKRYQTVNTYNQPGVGAYVTVRYEPK
ncbi:MAG: TonB-dependent vitamin B12 receptor [Candidatus Dactylopiibacterium sp.]|nr:TonB-dependent vitamin B12 receptor [Candidatus Dactylopiibacterium sp.]